MAAALLAGCTAWAAVAPLPEAWAKDRRTIAVLEFRAGAEGATDVALRLAMILRQLTAFEVIDPDDARRITGARVDAALARCSGDAECVAKLGARLGADEVIVVGVSEFGDLILALQRVDVARARVLSRVAESLERDAEPDDAALEGYLRRLLPPHAFLRYGRVVIRTNVEGAKVWLGGKLFGMTPLGPLQVEAPAKLDVRIAKAGYLDFRARIEVPPEATIEVRPTLVRDRGPAWYEKWWVWAIAGGLVVGAGVTGAILLWPEPTSVPVVFEPR